MGHPVRYVARVCKTARNCMRHPSVGCLCLHKRHGGTSCCRGWQIPAANDSDQVLGLSVMIRLVIEAASECSLELAQQETSSQRSAGQATWTWQVGPFSLCVGC